MVFLMHQGHPFLFLAKNESDEPLVIKFVEGEGIEQVASAFSEWFAKTINEEIQVEEALSLKPGGLVERAPR